MKYLENLYIIVQGIFSHCDDTILDMVCIKAGIVDILRRDFAKEGKCNLVKMDVFVNSVTEKTDKTLISFNI